MAVLHNSFEGGSNGTTITVANSGGASGDAFTQATTGVAFSTTRAFAGSTSALIANPAGGATLRYASGSTSIFARAYFYWDALPAADDAFMRLEPASQTMNVIIKGTNAGADAGKVWIYRGGDQVYSNVAIPAAQWIRVELFAKSGSGGTAELRIAFYAGDSTTPLYDSGLKTGLDLAAGADLGLVLFGTTGAHDTNEYMDNIGLKTGADAVWGAWTGANNPPAVTAASTQDGAASSTVNLSFPATDSDGTVASRATTFDYPTSGAPPVSGGATATPSFTAGTAGSLYTVRHAVTDNSGGVGYGITEVRIPVSGTTSARMVPVNGTGNAGWTIGGGSATDGAALSDGSDATYVQSPLLSTTETIQRWRLEPMSPRSDLKLTLRLWVVSGTDGAVNVRLYDGATIRQAWNQSVTATATAYDFTVTAPGAIEDWGNLYVEVAAQQ